MWDRLRITPHHSGRQAPNPLDDNRIRVGLGLSYGNMSTAKGYSYSIKGGPAPPRPPREFFASRFETAPRVQSRITVRTSNFRPASSVYPEEDSSPEEISPPFEPNYAATVATRYDYRYRGADEISPPSSPEPDDRGADRFLPGDVSPIDEDDAPVYPRHVGIPNTDNLRSNSSNWTHASEQYPRTQSPPQNRGATSIPMLRRERRKQSEAGRDANPAQRGPNQQQSRNPPGREAPRWDPLMGEQTSNAPGRPSQVQAAEQPAEFAQGLGITAHAWASPQNSPSTAAPSFGDRVRRIAKKAAAAREINTDPAASAFTSSSRPGWRGASGRTAIVDPVHDTREVPPLKIPEKSARRNLPPAASSKSNNTQDGQTLRGQTPPISPPSETQARPAPLEAIRRMLPISNPAAATPIQSQTASRYPSPPLSGNPGLGDAPSLAARELARDGLYGPGGLPSPTLNTHAPESSNAIRRKPPPVHTNHHHQPSGVSSIYSQQTDAPQPSPQHIPDTARPPVLDEEPYVQPPSRFSFSTYATSKTGTTRDDDVVDNEQPPVPSVPAGYQPQPPKGRASSDYSLITSPIDQFMTSPFHAAEPSYVTTPKPAPTSAPNPAVARAQALAVDRPSSRASASDMNKDLPPAPPEQSASEAQDRVRLLNAQLSALANRRINIDRSIKQMTELMPTDKLLNSAEVVRKREAEKKKVEALQQELADVRREEYELGLKLHRAYKRQDREAEWEPTTLWVRRVTG
ncbi:uncharacterized protein B0T15DRAFT_552940 [Chaetomium strumarium]|uniref:Uncharacterized protein n=1 Tax=Chaetomium strumarium TaxID=1170767 RepID=A0AAJ0M2N9_9PEZI|nr:hypothetical protein B0T15DRAFT_552940 [Chaetomium strumarium]